MGETMSCAVPSTINTRSHEVVRLPVAAIPGSWILLEPFIRKALGFAQGELDAGSLLELACRSKIQVWVIYAPEERLVVGVATTSVEQYPLLSALRVITLGGEGFSNWWPLLHERLVLFARTEGCRHIEAVGRKGLGRLVDGFGFKPKYTTFVKEL